MITNDSQMTGAIGESLVVAELITEVSQVNKYQLACL